MGLSSLQTFLPWDVTSCIVCGWPAAEPAMSASKLSSQLLLILLSDDEAHSTYGMYNNRLYYSSYNYLRIGLECSWY